MDPQHLDPLAGLALEDVGPERALFAAGGSTLEISFWDEDILRLRFGGSPANTYPIIVGQPSGKALSHECADNIHYLRCGAGEAQLDPGRPAADGPPDPATLSFYHRGKAAVQPSPDGHFVRRFRLPPFARTEQGWFFSVALQAGAPIYGFGEKFATLNKRGQRLVSWAEDALGVNGEVCYKNAPFCWTPNGTHHDTGSAGYGVFIHTTARVTHGAGYPAWSNWSYAALVEDEVLDIFFIAAADPARIIRRYTDITGRTPEVPLWSLGTWISRAYYKDFAEAEGVARTIRDRRIPCDVFTLDGRAWLDTRTRFYFEWDAARYPEPARFTALMRELDLKLCVWEYPLCSVHHPKFAEFEANGWFLKDDRGETYRYRFDPAPFGTVLTQLPDSGLFDFSVPEAARWWHEQQVRLHEMGVDVFKVDFGEQVPEDAVAANGDAGGRYHNALPLLYNKVCFEAAAEHAGRGLVFSRSGWAGSQRYPVQWGGDPQASWNGLAGSIIGGQSWGMTGAPFYAHDIGGFYGGPPDAELYIRWLQAGIFTPFCRIHGIGPREPWYFGEEAETIARDWLALRYRLIPYLQRQVREAMRSGLPIMRSMALAFPKDRRSWGFELQYMFGDHLLIAPVLQPGGAVSVCLPDGVWFDYFTGGKVAGGQVLELIMPLDRIPVFVRSGAVLAEGPAVQHTGEITAANRIEAIRVFGLPAGDALDHEDDLRLSADGDTAVIACREELRCEVFGVEYRRERGMLTLHRSGAG